MSRENLSCSICGFFCNNDHHHNCWFDTTAPSVPVGEKEWKPGEYYQPLFDLLHNEHGLLPLETDMADIIDVVKKMISPPTSLSHFSAFAFHALICSGV